MKRREFIALIGGGAAAWPLVVRAQQVEQMRHIGVIFGGPASDSDIQARLAAFRQVLQQLGWTEGRTYGPNLAGARAMPTTLANMQRNWPPSPPT